MAIILKNGRALSANANAGLAKYERNKEYLDLPNLVNGDEKIYLLTKIYETENHFSFKVTSNYQIDWGDGQGIQTYSSNTQADYEIDWNDISNTTLTSDGYKQAIITIEPQSGSSLTYLNMGSSLSNPNGKNNGNRNIVDCKMAGQNFTSFANSFSFNSGIEQFEFIGTAPNASSVQNMFKSSAIKKIISLDTSNVFRFSDFLSGCSSLIELCKFDLSSATQVTNFFENNSSLRYIEPYDLDNEAPLLTTLYKMFDTVPLEVVPITSASNITNFTQAFEGCNFKRFDVPQEIIEAGPK